MHHHLYIYLVGILCLRSLHFIIISNQTDETLKLTHSLTYINHEINMTDRELKRNDIYKCKANKIIYIEFQLTSEITYGPPT